MSKTLIGNFKGPKGDRGDAGDTGIRGSRWNSGIAITGTSNAATVFGNSGIEDALKNDMYLNTETGNTYRCTVGGTADTAKWVYAGNIKGKQGDKGEKGDPGQEGGASIATKEDAGSVKPADGLTVEEDGTLKVNIDGTTLTMDQVNNVIKLADTLKDAINGAFPAANVANNQITTVEGFALDARQANPNIDGSLAKQISDLNGSIIPNVTLPDIGSFETDQQAFEYIFNHVIADMAFSVCSFFYKGAWIAFGLVYSSRKYGILYFSNFEGTKRRLICIEGEFSYHETW